MSGPRIVSRWTGSSSAVCGECGTRFDGLVCPTCRQHIDARDLGRIGVEFETEAGDRRLVIAERNPDTGGWETTRTYAASDEAVRMLDRQHPDAGPVGGLFGDGPEAA